MACRRNYGCRVSREPRDFFSFPAIATRDGETFQMDVSFVNGLRFLDDEETDTNCRADELACIIKITIGRFLFRQKYLRIALWYITVSIVN